MNWIETQIRKQINSAEKSPYLWLLSCLFFAGIGLYLSKDLRISSNMQDLLPSSAKSVIASEALNQRLGSADILVLTLKTKEFEKVKNALPQIADALKKDPDIVDVIYQQDISLIQKNALTIFPSVDELKNAVEELDRKNREEVAQRLSLGLDDEAPKEVEKPKEVEQMKDFDSTEFTAKVCSLDNPDCESCGA